MSLANILDQVDGLERLRIFTFVFKVASRSSLTSPTYERYQHLMFLVMS
jgi:hypothetical protein